MSESSSKLRSTPSPDSARKEAEDASIQDYVQKMRERLGKIAPRTSTTPPEPAPNKTEWPLPPPSPGRRPPVERTQEPGSPKGDSKEDPQEDLISQFPQSRAVSPASGRQSPAGPGRSTPTLPQRVRPPQQPNPPPNTSRNTPAPLLQPPSLLQPPGGSPPYRQQVGVGPRLQVRPPPLKLQNHPQSSPQAYVPPSNVHPPPLNIHSPPSFSQRPAMSSVPTARPLAPIPRSIPTAQNSRAPSVPVIREEPVDRVQSIHPSVSSMGTLDVLDDYYGDYGGSTDDEKLEVRGHSLRSSLDSGPGPLRQASQSKREKPTLMLIRSPSGREKPYDQSHLTKKPTSAFSDGAVSPASIFAPSAPLLGPPTPPKPSKKRRSGQSTASSSKTGPSQSNLSLATILPSQLLRTSNSSSPGPSAGGDSKMSGFSSGHPSRQPSPVQSSHTSLKPIESRFQTSPHLEAELNGTLSPPRSLLVRDSMLSTGGKKSERTSVVEVDPEDKPVPDNASQRSVTSLPGLIQRALRLASNLERGKTSSKFGLDWMTINSVDGAKRNRQSAGSLKSMMNSFPEAGGNPRPDAGQLPLSRWGLKGGQSGLRHSELMSPLPSLHDGKTRKWKRRCCFMPLWLFVTLLVIIVLVIVAAVLVPIELIVIPKNQPKTVATCQTTHPCAHGGGAVLSTSNDLPQTCQCLCINGWTGETCSTQDLTGCVNSALGGEDSSVGSAIPRLVTLAPTYNIVLNATSLYAALDGAQLSCTSQNALVTLNGLMSRSLPVDVPEIGRAAHIGKVRPRYPQSTVTANGIVFAATSPPGGSTPTIASSSTATLPTGTPSPSPSFNPTSQRTLDFSRVAILHILQTLGGSGLSAAVEAQQTFQMYLTDPGSGNPDDLNLGNGWSADLVQGTVSQS